MSSRITADLQRVDRAIRPGVSHRALLKSGSSEAWIACLNSLHDAVQIVVDSSFAGQHGSAAVWIHWRKSSTSKQLLGLLRSAVEEAPGSAPLTAGCVRECALHLGIRVISIMFKNSQHGALWPAMREWIVDQGGLQALWSALAWSMALVGADKAAHDAALRVPVHAIISLMVKPDSVVSVSMPSAAYPSIAASLTLLFSDLLPRDLASGNAQGWRLQVLLGDALGLCVQLDGSQPLPQLHRAFIVAWPHFMGWLRQQQQLRIGMQQIDAIENPVVRHTLT